MRQRCCYRYKYVADGTKDPSAKRPLYDLPRRSGGGRMRQLAEPTNQSTLRGGGDLQPKSKPSDADQSKTILYCVSKIRATFIFLQYLWFPLNDFRDFFHSYIYNLK